MSETRANMLDAVRRALKPARSDKERRAEVEARLARHPQRRQGLELVADRRPSLGGNEL